MTCLGWILQVQAEEERVQRMQGALGALGLAHSHPRNFSSSLILSALCLFFLLLFFFVFLFLLAWCALTQDASSVDAGVWQETFCPSAQMSCERVWRRQLPSGHCERAPFLAMTWRPKWRLRSNCRCARPLLPTPFAHVARVRSCVVSLAGQFTGKPRL